MKFAKHMASKAVPDWKPFYLDYKRLKKELEPLSSYIEEREKLDGAANGSSLPPEFLNQDLSKVELSFQEAFKEEVDKVEYFTYSKLKQCKILFQQLTLQFFELKYPSNNLTRTESYSRPASLTAHESDRRTGSKTNSLVQKDVFLSLGDNEGSDKLSGSLHRVATVIKHLSSNFIPLNKLALYKIFKKHDKITSKVKLLSPDSIPNEQLELAQELLNTAKQDRRFYFRFKDDATALLEEVQHMLHEVNRLSIRKRQDGII